MARPPTRAHTAPELSLEHDAEALERPTRARTAPVARHTEPNPDSEAVPRTPWPGYGIQPVSGPLTPCTACSVP